MKLTQDEAFRIIDRVTDWLYARVGENVSVEQQPGVMILKTEDKRGVPVSRGKRPQ